MKRIKLKDLIEQEHKIYVQSNSDAPEGKKIHTGPRGGQYFIGSAQEKEQYEKKKSIEVEQVDNLIADELKKNNISYNEEEKRIILPEDAKTIPENIKKIIDKIIENSDGKILAVKTALGYSNSNSIRFILPGKKTYSKKSYHVVERKYVENILKNGLTPSNAQKHSNEFGEELSWGSKTKQTYKASFMVNKKGATKKIKNLFKFEDPVVLEIDTSETDLYHDPLVSFDWKDVDKYESMVAFNAIPANNIKVMN